MRFCYHQQKEKTDNNEKYVCKLVDFETAYCPYNENNKEDCDTYTPLAKKKSLSEELDTKHF